MVPAAEAGWGGAQVSTAGIQLLPEALWVAQAITTELVITQGFA